MLIDSDLANSCCSSAIHVPFDWHHPVAKTEICIFVFVDSAPLRQENEVDFVCFIDTIPIQLSFASDVVFVVAKLDRCFKPASLLRASTTLRERFGRSNATSFQQVLNEVSYRRNSRVTIEHLARETKVCWHWVRVTSS